MIEGVRREGGRSSDRKCAVERPAVSRRLTLSVLPGEFGVCCLDSAAEMPAWADRGGFVSVTRTPEELSIVCSAASIPTGVQVEKGWRCLRVEGPLDFDESGVLSSLAEPLARAGISIFAVSTYRTDYLLVKGKDLDEAVKVLRLEGHTVRW